MPVYISMLRGVNVGPHNRMKMDELQKSLETFGFKHVQTYIQSGNIIFHASKMLPDIMSKKIEARLLSDFGLVVPVITKTSDAVGRTIHDNPFLKEREIDLSKLHVTFLSQAPTEAAFMKLISVDAGPDKFRRSGDAIYLHCPNGYSETKLSNGFFEKALSLRATTRNWKTVNKLYEMALQCG
jgi:uncharacterized protein (DUF1697 family)